jgi:hypothetical protein
MTQPSGHEPSARELLSQWLEIIRSGEFDRAVDVLDENVVAEWPQSRERVVGRDNLLAIMTHYPGGRLSTEVASARFIESSSERYIMTPMFTTVKTEGTGNQATGTVLTRYPDGSDWYIVMSAETRNGKIVKNNAYFAPVYEAPEWRAEWVERMASDDEREW